MKIYVVQNYNKTKNNNDQWVDTPVVDGDIESDLK